MVENKDSNNIDFAGLMAEAKTSEAGFDRLCEACLTPVYRYILLRVRHKETAEDLTQIVFLKAYNSLKTFKDTGKSPLAWFFTIARNAVIDHFRANKNVFVDSEDALVNLPSRENFIEALDDQRDMGILKELMLNLSGDQQEILILKFINDLSNREISQLLNKSEESVRQLQSRGLKALKKLVDDKFSKPI